jgi:hypothetical protein
MSVRSTFDKRIESSMMGAITLWSNKRRTALIAVIGMSILAPLAQAADRCVGDSPTAVAQWVWRNRPSLNTPDAPRFITSDFLGAIRRDAARADRREEICAICDGDLWTNSQEGEARPPLSFTQAAMTGIHAEVDFSFGFSIEPGDPPEARTRRIILRRERECWKIDDLRHGAESIKQAVKNSR